MKRAKCVGLFLLLAGISLASFANETQERLYLIQVLNQLDAMQPLVLAAEKNQPKNTRIQFHYQRYRDQHGHWHNGLLDDIHAIKQGILQQLNGVVIEPRFIQPITGDYLDQPSGASK